MGKRLRRNGANAPWLTVIGIVGDVHDVGYGQAPDAVIYIPYAQNNVATSPIGLVVRTEGDPLEYGAAVKAAIWAVDPAQPISSISTLEAFLSDSLGAQRFRSVLLGLFGTAGLLLAAVGVYAVTARSVAERTREVGVRIALGGQPHRVWWAIARRTLGAFAAGLGAGCAGAVAAASLLASLFPEVQATSPFYAAPAFVLLVLAGGGTTLAAAYRATRVESDARARAGLEPISETPRTSVASEPRERSAPTKRRTRARLRAVGASARSRRSLGGGGSV